MEKIKVGVFGAGRGTTAINQLLRRGDAEVVAICDKYEPGLEKCRETALKAGAEGISFYTDFDKFEKHDIWDPEYLLYSVYVATLIFLIFELIIKSKNKKRSP